MAHKYFIWLRHVKRETVGISMNSFR